MLLPEVWNIMSATQYTIGFANQSEAYDFPVVVRKSLEKAAAEYSNVNLIVRDNNLDDATALANIEEFADIPVDLAIIYHLGQRIGPTLSSTLLKKKIKMIAVDIPIPLSSIMNKIRFASESTRTVTLPPSGVYLMALPTMFIRAADSLSLSAMSLGSFGASKNSKDCFFSFAKAR